MKSNKKIVKISLAAAAVVLAVVLLLLFLAQKRENERYALAFYGMSTLIDQKVYGPHAQQAMDELQAAFTTFEAQLSLYDTGSDIAAINAAAGTRPVAVSEQTFALLEQGKALSLASENAFALTLAPLSLAWGITSESPKVLTQAEIAALLPLVDDSALVLDATAHTAQLQHKGQAIDLGGIAKGTACNLARDVYEKNGVTSALLSIGGNIYAKGTKPDGSAYRIGFRDPTSTASASIASITLQDTVFAVSGGYERFFEQEGIRYHHILDPKTGAPADSDIVSVGVIHPDGTVADFYSTTLFVWGKDKALEYLANGGCGMLLDANNTLYVSKALESSFELVESGYQVIFV